MYQSELQTSRIVERKKFRPCCNWPWYSITAHQSNNYNRQWCKQDTPQWNSMVQYQTTTRTSKDKAQTKQNQIYTICNKLQTYTGQNKVPTKSARWYGYQHHCLCSWRGDTTITGTQRYRSTRHNWNPSILSSTTNNRRAKVRFSKENQDEIDKRMKQLLQKAYFKD